MIRTPAHAARALALLAGFALLVQLGCGDPKSAPPAAGTGDAATAPAPPSGPTPEQLAAQPPTAELALPSPDLASFEPLVRDQIEERQRWLRRLLAQPDLKPDLRMEGYGELAVLYDAYGLNEGAVAAYRNAQRLAPGDFRWPYFLGQLRRAENRPAEAAAYLRLAQQLAPDDVPSRVRLGEVLIDLNQPQEAEVHLAHALALDPSCTPALFARGQVALAAGQAAQAVELFERVLALDPQATSVHYPLGLAYRQLGNAERAARELERRGDGEVRLTDPLMRRLYDLSTGQRTFLQAGEAAFGQKQYREAAEIFRLAVASDPLYTLPRLRLALALLQLGALDDAGGQLAAVLRIDPGHARAHAQLAVLLVGAGRSAEALEHYRAAARAEPDNPRVQLALANLLRDLGRPAEAVTAYAEVVRLEPANPDGWRGEALCLILAGDERLARERLQQGLEILPTDDELAHLLARLLATARDPTVHNADAALQMIDQVMQRAPGPRRAETLAMVLAALGQFPDAIQVQQRLLDSAREAGQANAVRRLQANLERYQQGQPCIHPWTAQGDS